MTMGNLLSHPNLPQEQQGRVYWPYDSLKAAQTLAFMAPQSHRTEGKTGLGQGQKLVTQLAPVPFSPHQPLVWHA